MRRPYKLRLKSCICNLNALGTYLQLHGSLSRAFLQIRVSWKIRGEGGGGPSSRRVKHLLVWVDDVIGKCKRRAAHFLSLSRRPTEKTPGTIQY